MSPHNDEKKKTENAVHKATIVVDSRNIMQGRREVQILHGNEVYRLRETSNGKLILNK